MTKKYTKKQLFYQRLCKDLTNVTNQKPHTKEEQKKWISDINLYVFDDEEKICSFCGKKSISAIEFDNEEWECEQCNKKGRHITRK